MHPHPQPPYHKPEIRCYCLLPRVFLAKHIDLWYVFVMKKMLRDISLPPHEAAAIQEAIRTLKTKFAVVEVRLFGSKARGTSDSESDIDLLVLTAAPISWRERNGMTDTLYDIQTKYDVVISLLVIPQKEWISGLVSVLPIHDAIEEEGIAA